MPGWSIYLDTNGNGQQDAGEPNQITDAFGRYAFTGLVPGPYTVREVMQPGWTQTYPPAGAYAVVLGAGQIMTGKDFGNTSDGSPSLGDLLYTLNDPARRPSRTPNLATPWRRMAI